MILGNDPDLLKDQESRREQNRVYLRSVLKTYFNDAYSNFDIKYKTKIAANLLDPSDLNELKLLIKNEFDRLNAAKPYWSEHGSYSYFGCISINNEQFTYNSKELLKYANELIDKIYPLLKDDINTVGFSQWMGSIRNTAEKVFLKNLITSDNHSIFIDGGFKIFKSVLDHFTGKITKQFLANLYYSLSGKHTKATKYEFGKFLAENYPEFKIRPIQELSNSGLPAHQKDSKAFKELKYFVDNFYN